MKVYKWPLDLVTHNTIELPINSTLLTVKLQQNRPTLWALVDPALENEAIVVSIYGTGHEIKKPSEYIATFETHNGTYVWHAFKDTK